MWLFYFCEFPGIYGPVRNFDGTLSVTGAPWPSDCHWLIPGTVDPND